MDVLPPALIQHPAMEGGSNNNIFKHNLFKGMKSSTSLADQATPAATRTKVRLGGERQFGSVLSPETRPGCSMTSRGGKLMGVEWGNSGFIVSLALIELTPP
jgi:hypothetical protein